MAVKQTRNVSANCRQEPAHNAIWPKSFRKLKTVQPGLTKDHSLYASFNPSVVLYGPHPPPRPAPRFLGFLKPGPSPGLPQVFCRFLYLLLHRGEGLAEYFVSKYLIFYFVLFLLHIMHTLKINKGIKLYVQYIILCTIMHHLF